MDRRDRAVSLADCIAAAAPRTHDAAVASSDPHLLAVCHDERIIVVTLPDSAPARSANLSRLRREVS